MKKILKKGVCLLIAAVMLLSGMSALAARVTSNPVVFVIGDSTACVYSEASLQTGWAQVLYKYFNDPYMISDCAVGGASSRSFYNNYWANVKSQIKSGDYVLIQFGHNDCKGEDGANDENEDINPDAITSDRYANPDVDETVENSFKWYLKKYVDEIKAIGATPIFVTSVERRLHAYYNAENSRLYRWVTAMQDYAADNEVAIIDIWADTRAQIVADCPESTSYHPWYTTYTD
ncbi:MAG: hypothetical protein IJE41_00720, partial [Clostridia bacterium]|nr:hypothetical protein [Clostridia bacterium]